MHILCRIVAGSRLLASPHHSHALPDGTVEARFASWPRWMFVSAIIHSLSHVLKFKSGHIGVLIIDACFRIDELRFSFCFNFI